MLVYQRVSPFLPLKIGMFRSPPEVGKSKREDKVKGVPKRRPSSATYLGAMLRCTRVAL
jgi:hypothetical protein